MSSNQVWPYGLAVRMLDGPDTIIRKVKGFGLTECQIGVRDPEYYSGEIADMMRSESAEHGVEITALWAGWPGRVVWDLVEGPETVGLVPLATRQKRSEIIKQGSDWAAGLGIKTIITHLGFVPEDANDPVYQSLIPVLQDLARHCRKNDQTFCWETGQETPTALLRTLDDTAEANVGVNLDPANLLLYGKGNPVDAVGILGRHIKAVHIKDGRYPLSGRPLGEETVVGEGQVDFPALLSALAAADYQGTLYIECEFAGPEQADAIRTAKERLDSWLQRT